MTSRGLTFTCALLLAGATAASAGERARQLLDSMNTPSSLTDAGTLKSDDGRLAVEDALPSGYNEAMVSVGDGINISPADIPAKGLTIFPDGTFAGMGGMAESHTQPLQDCKTYSTLAAFTADHGNFTRAPCSTGGPGQCFENFDLAVQNAATITLCTQGTSWNCTANACGAAGTINFGLDIREDDLQRAAPQTGLLQEGPGFFGNRTTVDGKAPINNFFTDAMMLRFVGDPLFPAACAASITAPTVVGFDLINIQNAAVNENIVTATLANGNKFVYRARGLNSAGTSDGATSGGSFTGLCCNSAIRNIQIRNIGNFGEGVDNVRYGNSGTCTRPKVDVTVNEIDDAVEALEVKLDNFTCTGGGSTKN